MLESRKITPREDFSRPKLVINVPNDASVNSSKQISQEM